MPQRTRFEQIALRYLNGFRRTVPPLAALGGASAWYADWPALAAGLLIIAIGELLETTYYLNVLRWAEQSRHHATMDTSQCAPSLKPTA